MKFELQIEAAAEVLDGYQTKKMLFRVFPARF
jgi:hypothetical protein